MKEEIGAFAGPSGAIAYRKISGRAPTLVWFGGFRSDMTGTKAQALALWSANAGRAFLRFDYSGHGSSEGRFEDGTISMWLSDALAAIARLTEGPLLLVGSSMGGWIAALAALKLKDRVIGAVFIAPAPDFTEELVWRNLSAPERKELLRNGKLLEHSPYSTDPNVITKALIDDGRKHLILGEPIEIRCAVRIIQGMADNEVPWRHAVAFAERLVSDDVEILLLKSGDHRLSKPHEIRTITDTTNTIVAVYG
jgi:pimeloyl-ACP methyl ester carboxylesterase